MKNKTARNIFKYLLYFYEFVRISYSKSLSISFQIPEENNNNNKKKYLGQESISIKIKTNILNYFSTKL